ncbi:choice-of-anchor C family PEP-CTERM protein [Aquabacterium sp.]|uniref:choice-of-anchor C family PEP-CTERM protein n=1 Tax=Aquabacterium sp. TaxID=1872578 RepID=UPI002E332648|nr:choice-of-anchor C family protein [Aquabacterium sp.]HEX5312774.1 choice-of-anchor C family protein [Aquabacterium sp.]
MNPTQWTAIGLACLATASAQAAPFTNGSFELHDPSIESDSSEPLVLAGETLLPGWDVLAGSINYVRFNRWQAADGDFSIDLNGEHSDVYGIAQTFDTLAGQKYLVSFALSGNPDDAPSVKSFVVSAAGTAATFTFDTTGHTRQSMQWLPQSFTFTATGASTTLRFDSQTTGPYGPALDNVRVTAVPEPSLMSLLIAGSAVAWRMRRRNQITSSL